jgi:2,4-dienoyl-CoA reductase-like NADH-dependent reductase (Old Yellow Enzyme family)/thioredoxin reductase
MTQFSSLFSKIRIGTVTVTNRIVMPAMATNGTTDGTASQSIINYLVERAKGEVGLIITEAAAVEAPPEGKLARYHLNISDDRYIPTLKRLTDEVHFFDTKIAIQLSHLGRQIHSNFLGTQPVAPSPIPCPVSRDMPRELTVGEIESLIETFIEAARRARDAGFDMVELHGCHGYLISEFFSRRSNQRNDQYGGDVNGRSRFCREIIKGIKDRLGPSFPVIVRMNGHDYIKDGATLEDMKEIAPLLVDAGADALHITAGVYGSYAATVAPMFERPGCFLSLAEGIKKVVSVPVIAVGRINDPVIAEEALQSQKADLVAMGRALIADPALPLKARTGKAHDICKCTACNQGCIDRINISMMIGKTEMITCMVNPRVMRESETEISPVSQPKNILVLGGGPGGLQAALTAAQRGHRVSLWEKEDALGGQLRLAGASPGRETFAEYISFMGEKVHEAGVDVVLNTAATYDSIAEVSPDTVIYALGAVPIIPPFVRNGDHDITTAWNVLQGNIPDGENIVIIGGGAVGLETAHFLMDKNKRVTVLEATKYLGRDMGPISLFYLRRMLVEGGVTILRSAEVTSVIKGDILFRRDDRDERMTSVETVILALGAQQNDTLAGEIKGIVPDVRIIGDALKPRKALEAIAEGFEAGRTV